MKKATTKPAVTAGRGKRVSADRPLTGRDFDLLTDVEKERIYKEAEGIGPDGGRPLTAAGRRRWARVKRKMGRPVVGNGSTRVQITVERGLLARADARARQDGLNRSELIARSLEAILAPA